MPPASQPAGRRVLIGHLISNGDCLYATAVARQIKHDDPDCHLTWAISTRCRSLLDGNPYVDAVWEWPTFKNDDLPLVWADLQRQAAARQADGEFAAVYLTQFAPQVWSRWDGTLRSAIFRGYPHPITVPIAPVVCLSEEEKENVQRFAQAHGLVRKGAADTLPDPSPVILFECAPGSGQSFVTPAFALEVSRRLLARFLALRVVVSSHLPIVGEGDPRILDASRLTFRENAELSHFCSLLVGCSSGLTWICTSDAARRLPAVQMLTNQSPNCNPPSLDHTRWGLPTDTLLEMFDCSIERAYDCVATALEAGFATARGRFHENRAQPYLTYRRLFRTLLHLGEYRQAAALAWRNKGALLHPSTWYWQFGIPAKWLAIRLLRLFLPRFHAGEGMASPP